MRVHCLQHVPFEDAANIGCWANQRGHSLTCTRLFVGQPLPRIDSFDWLVVMGGPMNVYQHDDHPWLVPEKELIREAIDREKAVLGVCLGAQLAADVLGGTVRASRHREIGWFPVRLTEAGRKSPLFGGLPDEFPAFHWHSDTFEIPPGAECLASSEACANQAFQHGRHVVGLQFHLDYSRESIEKMLRHCPDELTAGPFVQRAEEMLATEGRLEAIRDLLYRMLDAIQSHVAPS